LEEIKADLERTSTHAFDMNIVLKNSMNFSTTCIQLKVQKALIEDLTNRRKTTSEPQACNALTGKIQQEKQVEVELLARRHQWFQDCGNAQIEVGTASKLIAKTFKQIQNMQEKYNLNL
jgi:hypothetical protein